MLDLALSPTCPAYNQGEKVNANDVCHNGARCLDRYENCLTANINDELPST